MRTLRSGGVNYAKILFLAVLSSFVLFWIALLFMGTDNSGYPNALLALVGFIQKFLPAAEYPCVPPYNGRHRFRHSRIRFEADLPKLEMDHPLLISYIQKHYLKLPSGKPYRLSAPASSHYSQLGQSQLVAQLLQSLNLSKPGSGTFFEAGAFDGETFSNSLYFEKSLNWSGVLVEPDPRNANNVMSKNRRAILSTSCISGPRPAKLAFVCRFGLATCEVAGTVAPSTQALGAVPDGKASVNESGKAEKVGVWCFPLYSILTAANFTEIDYMVIDLEGHEMTVLRGFPFDRLKVRVIQLENGILNSGGHLDVATSAERLTEFRKFFRENWPMFKEYKALWIDVIFVNTDLVNI